MSKTPVICLRGSIHLAFLPKEKLDGKSHLKKLDGHKQNLNPNPDSAATVVSLSLSSVDQSKNKPRSFTTAVIFISSVFQEEC